MLYLRVCNFSGISLLVRHIADQRLPLKFILRVVQKCLNKYIAVAIGSVNIGKLSADIIDQLVIL